MRRGSRALYLLLISGFGSLILGSSNFHLIVDTKSYEEAKNHCRGLEMDLATIYDSTDMDDLINTVRNLTPRAWIGLEIGDEYVWHWSLPGQKLDYFNWRAGEPNTSNQDACAAMDPGGEWLESDCRSRRSFVCHGNGDTNEYVFVADTKSWTDAQSHCRDLASDLVSIHSATDNEDVRNMSMSQHVWIGLFRDPWKWSDGSNSSYRYWKPSQPNYLDGQECVVAVFRDEGKWNDLRCSGRRAFVCRPKKDIPTQETLPTDNSPTNSTTLPNNSSLGIVTFHFTVVNSSQQPNTSNFTTKEPTTVTNTEPLSHPSSTELHSATTEMSTAVTTPLTPSTAAQVTTDGVSAVTTSMGNTHQITTQYTSPSPSANKPDVITGNLILIQKNMTWFEAVNYCREHHLDLVDVTTREAQEKVAEMAREATSAHVWLGLRYTCKFKFWFWINSASGCYKNWAPGQGSEGDYGCGVTGAIEATGGQQWVGLPEMERLNFICHVCAG